MNAPPYAFPQSPGNKEEDALVNEAPPAGHFFGSPPTAAVDSRTIKVNPQAPQPRPQVTASESPAWFGADSSTDPFATIGQQPSESFFSVTQQLDDVSAGLNAQDNIAMPAVNTNFQYSGFDNSASPAVFNGFDNNPSPFPPPTTQTAAHEHRSAQPQTFFPPPVPPQIHSFQPPQQRGSVSSQGQSAALPSSQYSGFTFEETSFIGDETFEQLSISGSLSGIADAMGGGGGGVECSRCHRMNSVGTTFCGKCGFQLVQVGFSQAVPLMRTTTMDSIVSGRFSQAAPSYAPSAPAVLSQPPQANQLMGNMQTRQSSNPMPLVSFAFPPQSVQTRPTFGLVSAQPSQQMHQQQAPYAAPVVTTSQPTTPTIPQRVYPVFCFGFGGQVFASFPLKQMRFAVTATSPQPNVGIAHYRPGSMYRLNMSDIPGIRDKCIAPLLAFMNALPVSEKYVKVKDLLDYASNEWLAPESAPSRDQRKVLYRLLHLMLSHKGGLDAAGEDVLCQILLPENSIDQMNVASPTASPAFAPPVGVTSELTKLLIRGDRVGAVLLAISHQLWPHALLIASHVDRDTYCSTVSELARHVLPVGHPLRSLYLLFAGQPALVGAELGQMGPNLRNSWTWNLAMMLSNRTADDFVAITGLGDALLQSGVPFAAHVCFLLADDASLISGWDSPESRIVYLGCDHRRVGPLFYRDWVALRTTEILEYALRQASGGIYVMAHLQAFKLLFAGWLADLGLLNADLKY
jgi:hypothetical protein